MLDWVWKLTRQPARSPAAAVVTTASGGSIADISAPNTSALIVASLVTQEQRVIGLQHVAQCEVAQRRTGRADRHRQHVAAHQRRDGQAQLVQPARADQLTQPGRATLAQ